MGSYVFHITPDLCNQVVEVCVDLLITQPLNKLQPNRGAVDVGAVIVEQVRFDARIRDVSEVWV